jgi:trigger factor
MATDTITTTTTELPESRVRVQAEVAPQEIEKRVQQAARALGRDLRVPGFRRGKVPPPVVISRVGRQAVLDEAVRTALPAWYVRAVQDAGIAPVGDPAIDVGDLPAAGQPLRFSIEIGVRPTARLGQYKGLEVGRREPEASEEQVDAELEAMRERLATLEPVERPAGEHDFLVIDFRGTLGGEPFEGGEGRDQLVELGAGRLVPGFEEQLRGASAGEERTVRVTFPDDYGVEALRGREAEFAVTVKQVQEKRRPELDDDFASDAAGFDSLEELREDIRARLREADERRVAGEFRQAVLDAAVANATVEVPPALVHARAHEMWHEMLETLRRQGISREAYLRVTGGDEEALVKQAEPDAEQALRREAVVAAVIEAEGIDPSEDDVLEALEPAAQQQGLTPAKLLARVREQGRYDSLRQEIAQQRAIELLAEEAVPISVEQAKARDKLWTPGREGDESAQATQLWVPGS